MQGKLLCLAGLINAAFIGFLALDAIDAWLDELLAGMQGLDAFPSSDAELRIQGVLCSALFWMKPWHPWTALAAHRVETLLARRGDPNVALAASTSALKARYAHFRGLRAEAADLAELAEAATRRTGSRYQEMPFGLLVGELLLDAGRVEHARSVIQRSRRLVERTPVFGCWRAALLFIQAWLARAEKDRLLTLERLQASLSLAREGNSKHYLRHFECTMPPLFSLALDEGIEGELVQQLIGMFRLKPPAGAPDLWPRPIPHPHTGPFRSCRQRQAP